MRTLVPEVKRHLVDKLKDSAADGKIISRVNSVSGRVESLHLWVGFDRVKKIGPTSNSDLTSHFKLPPVSMKITFFSESFTNM